MKSSFESNKGWIVILGLVAIGVVMVVEPDGDSADVSTNTRAPASAFRQSEEWRSAEVPTPTGHQPRPENKGAASSITPEQPKPIRIVSADKVLSEAIDCFRHIELLKGRFAGAGENVERTLGGLQEVLLDQDVRLARLIDGDLDEMDHESLRAELVEVIAGGEDFESIADLTRAAAGADSETGNSLELLQAHYQVRLDSKIQGFGDVAELVEVLVGSDTAMNTDLLKDSWAFSAATTMLQERYDHAQERFDRKMKEIDAVASRFPPETVDDMRATAARVAQFHTSDIEALEAAYESVYAWRFANLHRIDSGELIEGLKAIELRDPSPNDLTIPEP